ncbi:MAG: Mu-like prophage major head subunit gpT family protein [Elusimicrobiaceae bacterium]|jgi:phage major head subunit gpT-like protein
MALQNTLKQINDASVILKAAFQKKLSTITLPLLEQLAMKSPSTSSGETYTGLNAVPKISEFTDERKVKQLLGKIYTILNKKWESTMSVKREDIERDHLGMYTARVKEMASKAKMHPLELLISMLSAGDTAAYGLCYDGQYFFDTDHAEGNSGNQSNKLSGSGTNISQFQTDYLAAKAAMKAFKDDQGEPFFGEGLELEGNLLVVVPLGLEAVAKAVLTAETLSGSTNTLRGEAKVIASSRLTAADSTDWYLIYTGGDLKPFINQEEVPVEFVALDNPQTNEAAFMRDEFLYGTYARYNVGYGLWQYAIKTVN